MNIIVIPLILLSSSAFSQGYDPHYYHNLITTELNNPNESLLLTKCIEMRSEAEDILSKHSFPDFVFDDYMSQLLLDFETNLGFTNLDLNEFSHHTRGLLLDDEYVKCSHFLLSLSTTLQAKKNILLDNMNYWLFYQINLALTSDDVDKYETLAVKLETSNMILQEIETFGKKWPSNDAIKAIFYYYMKERYNIIISWRETP